MKFIKVNFCLSNILHELGIHFPLFDHNDYLHQPIMYNILVLRVIYPEVDCQVYAIVEADGLGNFLRHERRCYLRVKGKV